MGSLTIWADAGLPPIDSGRDAGTFVLWRAFLPEGAPDTWVSLPEEVHRDRIALRKRYGSWLHDLGARTGLERGPNGRMRIRTGFSYWWMTLPADNSLAPDSPAYRAVRLMCLAALADRKGVTHVELVGADRSVEQLLRGWAESSHRLFQATSPARRQYDRSSLYRWLPPLAAARILVSHLGLPRRRARGSEEVTSGGIAVVDYLAHLSSGAEDVGSFASNYWGPLVSLLDDGPDHVTWLHISARQASRTVVDADAEIVDRFTSTGPSRHDLLHHHVTWGALARSCLDYVRVVRYGLLLRGRRSAFIENGAAASLWPAFSSSYRDQFYGRTAMLNVIWLNALEQALSARPQHRLGVYLFENQPWEAAFIHAWRAAGHGALLGVMHSTALFWDTRLFKDPRDEWQPDSSMPWPDRVAVNGPVMRTRCTEAGYPPERVVDVEALRYLGLLGARRPTPPPGPLRVLTLGEYSPAADRHLLSLVTAALDMTARAIIVVVRPHPACLTPATGSDPRLQTDGHGSVIEALLASDVAICGAQSSAAVDAACLGIPTLVVGDADVLMGSPAEGLPGTSLVFAPHQLARALDALPAKGTTATGAPADVFFTDPHLALWRSAIEDARQF